VFGAGSAPWLVVPILFFSSNGVLAGFDPNWLDLNFTVAGFEILVLAPFHPDWSLLNLRVVPFE
jgi:hypothetical protein